MVKVWRRKNEMQTQYTQSARHCPRRWRTTTQVWWRLIWCIMRMHSNHSATIPIGFYAIDNGIYVVIVVIHHLHSEQCRGAVMWRNSSILRWHHCKLLCVITIALQFMVLHSYTKDTVIHRYLRSLLMPRACVMMCVGTHLMVGVTSVHDSVVQPHSWRIYTCIWARWWF